MATEPESPVETNSGESSSTKESNLQPKLADVKFPETPEDQKEQPKSLKKKNSDRQNRRDRESQTLGDAARQSASSYRYFSTLSSTSPMHARTSESELKLNE